MWLSNEIFDWVATRESSSFGGEDQLYKPHEAWEHIRSRLARHTTEYDRAEIVVSLRRALDYRVQSLNSVYKFRSIPRINKKASALEIMVNLGLVLPLMTKKLIDIRNIVEHQHRAPPSQNECAELAEFVWYFLKSTDNLVRLVAEYFTLEHPENPSVWLSINMKPPAWQGISFYGFVPSSLLSSQPNKKWILVNLEKNLVSRDDLIKTHPLWDDRDRKEHSKHAPDDVSIHAKVDPTSPEISEFVKIYFHLA